MTKKHVIYQLDDPNPVQRAYAWGTFQGLRDRLSERKHQRVEQHISALKGNRNSIKSRVWTNANCRDAARTFIELLAEQYPHWKKCKGERLSGSHGNGGVGKLRLDACRLVKELKNPAEAKRYIHRGVNMLADNGDSLAYELTRKPWF